MPRAPCLLSCIDIDGIGRRLEAAFTCIAAAHALGPQAQYIHTRLFELQHGNSPHQVDDWFGLPRAFPALSARRGASGGVRISEQLSTLEAADADHRFVLRTAPEGEHVILHHTPPGLCAGLLERVGHQSFPAGQELRANRSWLHAVESGRAICAQDGSTVYTHADCTFYFWCTVAAERSAASWYAVLPSIQSAYISAGEHAAVRGVARPWPAAGDGVIRVGVHIRTVKRRLKGCFSGERALMTFHDLP